MPSHLRMSGRSSFLLRRQVTNTGTTPADAMTAMATFTFDGAPSMELDMAFGNGARESRWAALPPGESAHDDRAMGDLFTAPGTHTITMTVDGVTSSCVVRVDR